MVAITMGMIVPAIIMGIIIGIIEVYYLISDESLGQPQVVISHSIVAFFQVIILVFLMMNERSLFTMFPPLKSIPVLSYIIATPILFRVCIVAIEVFLLEFKARAFSGRYSTGAGGGNESWIHVFIIILLTLFSPEIWTYLIAPFFPWKFK